MVAEETGVSMQEAQALLLEHGSVRKAVDYFKQIK
jgi:hypothetical protein